MGSYTPNKGLYKADPIADAKDTFNITKMLNDNWDKLDADVAESTIDELASTYGYDISISESGNTTTTTLTIKSTSPVTASRKTVETVNGGSTTYVVTVTIDGESETMTHTIGTTTGSGVAADE
ncbi:MAG: hypothetical protein UC390_07645 [Peptococcaceae bacterium]|nr:hypothetical protein [Peptococcaceae bacterium]